MNRRHLFSLVAGIFAAAPLAAMASRPARLFRTVFVRPRDAMLTYAPGHEERRRRGEELSRQSYEFRDVIFDVPRRVRGE